jgi:hypothetical protein
MGWRGIGGARSLLDPDQGEVQVRSVKEKERRGENREEGSGTEGIGEISEKQRMKWQTLSQMESISWLEAIEILV